MAVLKHTIPFILTFALTACYENFNPEIDVCPVLCLNSLITPGEPIALSVTHTWSYNDLAGEDDHTVSDAEVLIYANGLLVSPDYLPAEGDEIRIEATSPTYGRAEASVTVPVAIPVAQSRFSADVLDHGIDSNDPHLYAYFNIFVELTIDDRAGSADYFGLNYGSWTYGEPYTLFTPGSLNYEAEPIFREHIGVFESIFADDDPGDAMAFYVFSDKQFAGRSYTLRLHIDNAYFMTPLQMASEEFPDCELTFYLSTLSRSYYDRAIYVWQRENGTIDDMADLGFAEPTWGYSNVSTGAGVVAARSTRVFTFSLRSFFQSVFQSD